MIKPSSESERKVRQFVRWLRGILDVLAVVGVLACPSARADDGAQPFVPHVWNPDALPDKPDLGGLGAIRFVTTNDYPPFGFTLANGAAAGYDVDLARALCEELQVTCTIQARAWDGIASAVTSGEADAAIASLAISDRADPKLAFTAPYYKTPARFVTRVSAAMPVIGPDALAGRRIGVESRSAHQAYLGLFFPRAVAVPFDKPEAMRAALKAGTVDAVFGDAVTWSVWLNGGDAAGCCAFSGGPYTESRFFGRGAGIAVRKGDATLRRALDYALARVEARGVTDDLYLKYFPLGLY